MKGIQPLVDILEMFGGWPVVKGDDWNSENWNWIEMNKQMFKNGLPDDLILECRIRTDFENSSKRIIQVKFQSNEEKKYKQISKIQFYRKIVYQISFRMH